mgnify:CR=1 FL=1
MKIISFIVLLTAAPAAHGQGNVTNTQCDQKAAEAKLLEASDAGIIKGVGMVSDIPSIAVAGADWDVMSLDVRLGMIETVECFIAGPGNILRSVQVMSPGGKIFATFDGVTREIDVRR